MGTVCKFNLNKFFIFIFVNVNIFRDPNTTTMFVVGSTFGEALVPVFIGTAMNIFGSMSMPYMTMIFQILLTLVYLIVHLIGSYSLGNKSKTKPITSASTSENDEDIDQCSISFNPVLDSDKLKHSPVSVEDVDQNEIKHMERKISRNDSFFRSDRNLKDKSKNGYVIIDNSSSIELASIETQDCNV
jgi:hypothetical protein